MSNHYHIICTDVRGLLPKFVGELNKLVAKCINASLGRWENVWAAGTQTSYVRLEDADAMIRKSAYALANPVAAGLVRYGREWPGVRLWQPGRYKAPRPRVFFSEGGKLGKSLDLEIVPLPTEMGVGESVKTMKAAANEREAKVRAQFLAEGRHFMGPRSVKAQSIYDSPQSHEARRGTSPRVATRDKWRRIESLQRLAAFVRDYRAALAKWRLGARDVVFPPGSYAMKRNHAVAWAPA